MTTDRAEKCPVIVLVGSTGKLGRLVKSAWCKATTMPFRPVFQTRQTNSADAFFWQPLEQQSGLESLVRTHGHVDAIISLAGIVPASSGQPLEMDRRIANAVMAAAAEAGISRVLISSSSAIYGVGRNRGHAEDDDPRPISPYGLSKCETEQDCATWRQRGLEVCALRIGNVAGADALLTNSARASSESPILIDRFADGHGPLRSYIGPRRFADVLLGLATMATPLPSIVNVAAPLPVRMEDLAECAQLPWQWQPAPTTAHQSITLDCALLASLLPNAREPQDPLHIIKDWASLL